MSIVDNERPPYITFERRPVEDRAASLREGHYVSRDVDYVIITRPGSRDTVEKEAEAWLRDMSARARPGGPNTGGSVSPQWLKQCQEAYAMWKNGQQAPTEGTPILGWQVLSPAAQKDIIHAGIRTVEDLAALPDSELGQLGIGATGYKQKAAAWLLAAKDTGKAAEQISSLTVKIEELVTLTREQAAEIANLRSQLPKATAVPAKA